MMARIISATEDASKALEEPSKLSQSPSLTPPEPPRSKHLFLRQSERCERTLWEGQASEMGVAFGTCYYTFFFVRGSSKSVSLRVSRLSPKFGGFVCLLDVTAHDVKARDPITEKCLHHHHQAKLYGCSSHQRSSAAVHVQDEGGHTASKLAAQASISCIQHPSADVTITSIRTRS